MPADPREILRTAASLLQSGRYVGAAGALRYALDLAPTDAEVVSAIAQVSARTRTLITLGRSQEALAVLAPLAESSHASGELLMLCGYALMSLGRKDDAEAVLRRWAEQEPGNRDAAWRLAAALADNDKPVEAESVVRRDIAHRGSAAEAAFVLGRSLLGQARFDEAETEFRKVVQTKPDHQIAHSNLMELVWMRTGDVDEASHAIDMTLQAYPMLRGLRIAKARLLTSARMPQAALAEIDAGLALDAQDPALLKAAATIALEFDGARALRYARRALSVVPHDRGALVAFGNASLAVGDVRQALDIAAKLHALDPADGEAVAMQADALRIAGDPRYRELLDYRNFVQASYIDTPPGWPDLAGYLHDLQSALTRAHTLHAHPIGNSLREGSQIQLLPEQSESDAIRAFPSAIDEPIRRYMQALGRGKDPMRSRNTGRYQMNGIWSVRLRPGGFHVSHYHPAGWISSACYLHLPAAVTRHGGEGWLKFGEPAFATRATLGPEYFIKPEPGLLVLFPSYMWHGTVPFSGDTEECRLTIAFDVVPVGAW
ncbi:MAG: putative 2OG-Fe(II) oxygenase [Rhodanobacteraceae bacterium]